MTDLDTLKTWKIPSKKYDLMHSQKKFLLLKLFLTLKRLILLLYYFLINLSYDYVISLFLSSFYPASCLSKKIINNKNISTLRQNK